MESSGIRSKSLFALGGSTTSSMRQRFAALASWRTTVYRRPCPDVLDQIPLAHPAVLPKSKQPTIPTSKRLEIVMEPWSAVDLKRTGARAVSAYELDDLVTG